MKKLRANMDNYFDKLDKRWRALSLGKQHQYMLCFFVAYLILTIGVVLKVWYDVGKSNRDLIIHHIENPIVRKKESTVSLQDSMFKIIKNKKHERR